MLALTEAGRLKLTSRGGFEHKVDTRNQSRRRVGPSRNHWAELHCVLAAQSSVVFPRSNHPSRDLVGSRRNFANARRLTLV